MKESDLTKKIMKELRARGGVWFKIHGSASQVAGLPDIIGCYRGRFVGIEVKLPGRVRVSKRQRLVLLRLRRAHAATAVVSATWAATRLLDKLDAELDARE